MSDDPAIIEAAARALKNFHDNYPPNVKGFPYTTEEALQAILAAVTPLIEASALERAAKLVDDDDHYLSSTHGRLLAAAIRALKPKTAEAETE